MKSPYTFMIFTVILGSWHLSASAQNVDFPDANLAAAVRSALGLAEGADIPQTRLQGLTLLFANISSANGSKVTNLTGLEAAIGLENLYLNHNQIRDITPLESLTNLTALEIRNNPISDFAPLGSLINLTFLNLIDTKFSSSDLAILSPLTNLTGLLLSKNEISDLTGLPGFPNLEELHLGGNQISDITPLGNLTAPTKVTNLQLSDNQITDLTPLARFTGLTQLDLSVNNIRDLTPLENLTNLEWKLRISSNQVSDLSPLAGLTKLRDLHFVRNQVSDLSPLAGLTKLQSLFFPYNQVSDLSPLENLTELRTLVICYNPYTDISPLQNLVNLRALFIDEVFVEANRALVGATTDATLRLCPPLPDPPPEPEPEPEPESEPEPAVKQRRIIARCGLGWSPHSQYQHFGELPKVMIYALEFEYDPESRVRKYACKTIEIRTGDDSIENLAGWHLYLGTLYNPSHVRMTIPEEHSQMTDGILRVTPEMLGLETFRCSTAYVISGHPLPSVHYVLKTAENVVVDTAYSCFIWVKMLILR